MDFGSNGVLDGGKTSPSLTAVSAYSGRFEWFFAWRILDWGFVRYGGGWEFSVFPSSDAFSRNCQLPGKKAS